MEDADLTDTIVEHDHLPHQEILNFQIIIVKYSETLVFQVYKHTIDMWTRFGNAMC